MPTTYQVPGIYIEELPGARPIEAVGASTAAFIGATPATVEENLGVALPVNNWTQFKKLYVDPNEDSESTPLSHAVYGFFRNGGSRCYVVNLGSGDSPMSIEDGLKLLEPIDEVAIVAAPEYTGKENYDFLLEHCSKLKDRVAILDAPPPDKITDVVQQLIKVGDGPPRNEKGYGAFYFPWLKVRDPLPPHGQVHVPPSGHIAGIWVRSDAARGVHKAPANEPVWGALDLSYHLTRAEQEALNPAGVNCLRWFSDKGICVWGARTVAPNSSEWRYLNVRRLFSVIEESIARSTRWIVFEPNDYTLWKSIRRDISAFLTLMWRTGALMGRTPEDAFFVKCDEETNPPEVIDAGQVVALIGIAPVKPAEFVIFRLSQTQAGTTTEVQGG